jgi:filamentous hemagglutinin
VIIANPAGIACSGCGFINANRVTLTTGTPQLTGGALDGYRVTGGTIRVDGAGLDASHADYTDIIARAVQVNAGIWSPELKVTTGANQVNADHTQITATNGIGDKPMLALDVSALGGMYAQKIFLVGTEQGVGSRNAGSIGAQAGELVVTVDGRLENTATGKLQSQTDNTRIDASDGLANAGLISAARELTISTPQDVDNSAGTLSAARIDVTANTLRNQGGIITQTGAQAMTLQAGTFSNLGGTLGMPVADSGTGSTPGGSAPTPPGTNPPSTGDAGSTGAAGGSATDTPNVTPPASLADGALRIAGTLNNDGGHITANAGFALTTDTGLSNDGGHLALRQLTLNAGDLANRGGELTIDGPSIVHANTVGNDAGTLTFNGPLQLNAQQLSNRAGTIQQLDTGATALSVAGTLDNTAGVLNGNASSLAITSGTLVNENGTINHTGAAGLAVQTGALYGAGGKTTTAGNVLLNAGAIDHRGATLNATQVTVNATSLDNRGGTIAASGPARNTLAVTGALDNGSGGTLTSNGDLMIQAGVFGNAGGSVNQAGTGALSIQAAMLNGAGGTIGSNGALMLTAANDVINQGILSSRSDALVVAGRDYVQNAATSASGSKAAAGSLTASDNAAVIAGRDAIFDQSTLTAGKVASHIWDLVRSWLLAQLTACMQRRCSDGPAFQMRSQMSLHQRVR